MGLKKFSGFANEFREFFLYRGSCLYLCFVYSELSPDRMDDFEQDELEDEYDAIPAYEAPHKRESDRKKRKKRAMQYPDPEFDRRWERKRREAEEEKEREIEERRRRREEERERRYSKYSDDEYSDDDRSRRRSYSRLGFKKRFFDYLQLNPQAPLAQKIADEVAFRGFQGEVEFF